MSKKKLFVYGGGGLVVILLLVYFAAQFFLSEREELNLFYNRSNGDFVSVTPKGVTVVSAAPEEGMTYESQWAGRFIEAEYQKLDDAKDIARWYRYFWFERNSIGGYDLLFDYDSTGYRELVEIRPLELKKQFREEIEKLPEDAIRAENYLIFVADESGVSIVQSMQSENYTEAQQQLNQYLSNHPDDLFGNILQLDLHSRLNDRAQLVSALEKFQQKFDVTDGGLVDYTVKRHMLSLAALESVEGGYNMPARSPESGGYTGMSGALTWDELNTLFLVYDRAPNVSETGTTVLMIYSDVKVPNFLIMQTFSKVNRVKCDFLLMQGRTDEAEKISLQFNRMAIGLISTGRTLIYHLIGVAINSIAVHQQHHTYLDGYQDADQLAQGFARFDEVYQEYKATVQKDSINLHPASGLYASDINRNTMEAQTRTTLSLVHMTNLHTAISMRHYQLKYNQWPSTLSAGELLEKMDTDPFSPDDSPLQKTSIENDKVIYSIGPDKANDFAKIEYDPSNGTLSAGDISLRIYEKRRYPFPASSPTYQSREELLAQYPNGLPEDSFAYTRGRSYIITDTSPPIIWSNGPDADQSQFQIFPEEYTLNPEKGFGAARIRDGSWMKMKNNPEEPFYDPSNGTISPGNLYLNFR